MSFTWFIYYSTVGPAATAAAGWAGARVLLVMLSLPPATAAADQPWPLDRDVLAEGALVGGVCGGRSLPRRDQYTHFSGPTPKSETSDYPCHRDGRGGGALRCWPSAVLPQSVPEALAVVLGWLIVGLTVAFGLGLIDLARPTRRRLLGLIAGGIAGGALAGLASTGVQSSWLVLIHEQPADQLLGHRLVPLIAATAILGFAISALQVVLHDASLRGLAGTCAGCDMILVRDDTIIGSGRGCDIRLTNDDGVDLFHARVARRHSDFIVEDARTRSGTFVNDERVPRLRFLRSGDVIAVGQSRFLFRSRSGE